MVCIVNARTKKSENVTLFYEYVCNTLEANGFLNILNFDKISSLKYLYRKINF